MTNRVCPEDLVGQEAVSVRHTPGPRASATGSCSGRFPAGRAAAERPGEGSERPGSVALRAAPSSADPAAVS